MKDAFKAAFGSQFKQYNFVGYPTDNFGVGTSYVGKADPAHFQCATWSCFGYTPQQVAYVANTNPQGLLTVDGYADEGTGGAVTLTTDQQKSIAAEAVVPSIYNILGINADVNWKKHVNLIVAIPKGHVRFLNADAFARYMNTLPADNPRRAALRNGQLVVVWSDLVADAMTVTIDIDTSTDAALDAKLNAALAGKTGTIIGKDASLAFKVNAATTGHYEMQTLFPVIVAVLAGKPPITQEKEKNALGFTHSVTAPDFRQWRPERVRFPSPGAAKQ